MAAIPLALAGRAAANYFQKRPYCASFELTHNCNAQCRHCHRGAPVPGERLATPERLLELCRELRPIVAIMSGGEPLLRRDLPEIVRTLKQGCAPLRVFVNTNAALLTPARFGELVEAGVDEVLTLDTPTSGTTSTARSRPFAASAHRGGPREPPAHRVTSVLQSENFARVHGAAGLGGVNINPAPTPGCGLIDMGLMIQPRQTACSRGGRAPDRVHASTATS
jgi:hypothetical protein